MKKQTVKFLGLLMTGLILSQCNVLTSGNSSSDSSDETDTEAAFSSAVSALVADQGTSSAISAGVSSSLTTDQQNLQIGITGQRKRFRCVTPTSVYESFSCDNSTGAVTRVVTFTECEVSNSNREGFVNGSFTNTITNGGDGLCNSDDTISFENMVLGRSNLTNDQLDAVHTHQTGADNMVFSFTNARGKDVTVTRTADVTTTFTDAVDANDDGMADSVTVTNSRDITFVHEIDGNEAHNVSVFTTDDSFVSTTVDEDGNSTDATIELALPTEDIVFDADGNIETRTITAGELVVDHNLAKIRLVFGVGADGLEYDDGTTCGPVNGTMNVTGYEINDDNTIGGVVGTGTVTFADGEVQTSMFDGVDLTIRPTPCE